MDGSDWRKRSVEAGVAGRVTQSEKEKRKFIIKLKEEYRIHQIKY